MPFTNAGPSSQVTTNTQTVASNLSKVETLSVNLGTIAGIATITATEITFSGLGTGILAGDVILSVSKPTAQAGLGIAGWRNDPAVNDKFYITYVNPTAGTVTPTASETYLITVGRPIPGSATIATVV
jgi:hypothetical protein